MRGGRKYVTKYVVQEQNLKRLSNDTYSLINVAYTYVTVSYTHLDVYKRQIYMCVCVRESE